MPLGSFSEISPLGPGVGWMSSTGKPWTTCSGTEFSLLVYRYTSGGELDQRQSITVETMFSITCTAPMINKIIVKFLMSSRQASPSSLFFFALWIIAQINAKMNCIAATNTTKRNASKTVIIVKQIEFNIRHGMFSLQQNRFTESSKILTKNHSSIKAKPSKLSAAIARTIIPINSAIW